MTSPPGFLYVVACPTYTLWKNYYTIYTTFVIFALPDLAPAKDLYISQATKRKLLNKERKQEEHVITAE